MRKTMKFFIITIVVSWLLWLPTVVHTQWMKVPNVLLLLGMFAGFVPSLVGLVMLKSQYGDDFKSHVLNTLKFSFSYKWLLVMLIFPIQAFVTLLLVMTIDKSFVVVNPLPPYIFPLIFLQILFVGGAIGEEFGWRGYAQDRLQEKYGIIYGTIILGLIWSLWHLPLFFMLNTVQSHIPIWQFMLQNTVLAFFYTWIYNRSKGNISLMILLHAVMNTSSAMIPYWQSNLGRYLGLAIMVLLLVLIKVFDKKAFKLIEEN